jgi:predicted RNA binding protein YcfA (HicA-like mRNA interferase family)
MKHPDGRATVIPIHTKEAIGPGLFSKILRDADLSRDEFLDLIEK